MMVKETDRDLVEALDKVVIASLSSNPLTTDELNSAMRIIRNNLNSSLHDLRELKELRDKWFKMADLHDHRRHPNARPDVWYDIARKEDAQELRDLITKIEMT